MKRNLLVTLLVAAMLFTVMPVSGLAGASSPRGNLVVCTSVPTTQLNMLVDMFNSQYPGIAVDVCWSQNNDLVDLIQAGSSAGDVFLGGSLDAFRSIEHRLIAYNSPDASALHSQYTADRAFIPVQLHVSAMIVNPDAALRFGAEVKGWESLSDESLSGRVAYMDPDKASPDTQQADFIRAVAQSAKIAAPSAPSFVLNAVSAGQFAAGITSEDKAIEYKKANAALEIVYPQEGVAMSASYAGLLSGAANEANARLFIDFLTSKAYQQAAADQLNLRSVRTDVEFNLSGVLPTAQLRAVNYDTMMLRLIAGAEIIGQR